MDYVKALLETNERDDDTNQMSEIAVVALKVCCQYYAVIRQDVSFKTLGRERPRLAFDMLDYVAAKGGDMLGIDPRSGTHAVVDS